MRACLRQTGAALLIGVATVAALGFAAEPAAERNVVCVNNLKQLGIGMMMYMQDYDETLPPMKLPAQVQKVLMPYVKPRTPTLFTCPVTGLPYQPNAALSQKKQAKIQSPGTTWMFRDVKAHPDGLWTVAYVDGHVKQVSSLPGSKK